MTYQEYVEAARRLIKQIECHQAKIAEMAISVCQIRHGGRSKGFYTLNDFANDVGMCSKSLQNWVTIYRDVLLKVNIPKPTIKDWTAASKTANILKSQRTSDNSINGSPRTRRAYKQGMPIEKVAKIFNDVSNGNSAELKLERIFSSTRYNNTILKELDLEGLSDSKLITIMEWLDESSEIINTHLTSKKKRKKLH